MKTILLILSIAFLLVSCQKENIDPEIKYNVEYVVKVDEGKYEVSLWYGSGLFKNLSYSNHFVYNCELKHGDTAMLHCYAKVGDLLMAIVVNGDTVSQKFLTPPEFDQIDYILK